MNNSLIKPVDYKIEEQSDMRVQFNPFQTKYPPKLTKLVLFKIVISRIPCLPYLSRNVQRKLQQSTQQPEVWFIGQLLKFLMKPVGKLKETIDSFLQKQGLFRHIQDT